MFAFRNRRWSALVVVFSLATPSARAGMITPDSIPNPPSAVSSANGTPVYPSNFVAAQYKGLGLIFSPGAAITKLNGGSVWVPIEPIASTQGLSDRGSTNYYFDKVNGSFVSPGRLISSTVSSVTLGIIGQAVPSVYGINGQQLNISPVLQPSSATNGSQAWTFTGSDIGSFSVAPPVWPPISGIGVPATTDNPAWGVASVSFTPTSAASAPEPSSLALAGLDC